MKKTPFLPFLLLIILSLIWGSSFILMKEGLKSFSPMQVAAFRLSMGGMVFLPLVVHYLRKVARTDLKYILLSGLIGNGIPAFLFTFAQTRVDSSVAGALNALTPMFTLLIGFSFGVIVLNTSKILGVIIGLSGALAIIFGRNNADLTFNNSYTLLIVLATIMYGANINIIKSKLSKYPAIVISALPLFFISVPGLFILLSSNFVELVQTSDAQMTKSIVAIVLLALLGNSLSLILFNRLIQVSGPVFAASVTYFIPVVALLWGVADKEVVTALQICGLLLILAGIYLVNKRSKKPI